MTSCVPLACASDVQFKETEMRRMKRIRAEKEMGGGPAERTRHSDGIGPCRHRGATLRNGKRV